MLNSSAKYQVFFYGLLLSGMLSLSGRDPPLTTLLQTVLDNVFKVQR